MKLRYVGPHDRVAISAAGVPLGECDRGETIDVPDAEAARMLEQPGNWEAVRSAPVKKADKATSEEEVV